MSTVRRIGLIGFGSIAEHGHLPALRRLGVEVAAIADISPCRLEHAARAVPGAVLFAQPADLIAYTAIDAVDICAPPHTHADLIVAACARGLRTIISEKPFVLSEAEFARVSAARVMSGSRIVSVNNWLYSDLFGLVAGVLRSGEIGQPRRIELRTARPAAALGNDGWEPAWRTDPAVAGGGIMLDHGWHQLYLLFGWLGTPRGVAATTRSVDPRHFPVEDEATIELTFPGGSGRIDLCWTAKGRENEGLIEADEGRIIVHDDRITVIPLHGPVRDLPFAGRLTQSSYHPDWFEQLFRCSMLDGDTAESDRNFAEAGLLVSVIGAAYRSARRGGEPQPLGGVPVAGTDAVYVSGPRARAASQSRSE